MASGREAVPSKADGSKGRVDSAGEGCVIEIPMFCHLAIMEQDRALFWRALFLLPPSSLQGKAMAKPPSPEVWCEPTQMPGQCGAAQLRSSLQPMRHVIPAWPFLLDKELQISKLLIWLLGLIANAGLELSILSFTRLNVTACGKLTRGLGQLEENLKEISLIQTVFLQSLQKLKGVWGPGISI